MLPTYGLTYDLPFLHSLPLLRSSSDSHVSNPIRLLTAHAFGELHLQHTLSHPPDNILFPFLHGLEGDNHAQNAFFHSSAIGAPQKSYGSPATVNANYAARVPRYRGLAWVICEEDLLADVNAGTNEAALCVLRRCLPHELGDTESDDEDDMSEEDDGSLSSSSSSSFGADESEDDIELDHPNIVVSKSEDDAMDVAVSQVPLPISIENVNHDLSQGDHMHPIQHRPLPTAIKTSAALPQISHSLSIPISSITSAADGAASDGSISASSSISSSSCFDSASSPSTVTSVVSVDCMMSPPDASNPDSDKETAASPAMDTKEENPRQNPSCFSPCLLTSTFRPKQLLKKVVAIDDSTTLQRNRTGIKHRKKHHRKRRSKHQHKDTTTEGEHEWDFVQARVPDGISLRNFGIQVPIYATLCDIVIYSPKGPTKRAIALAERFRCAIERKRKERIKRHLQARLAVRKESKNAAKDPETDSPDDDDEDAAAAAAKAIEAELEEEFLHYNVFVLSANDQQMRKEIPYLVMRVSISPGASASAGWEIGHAPGSGPKAVDSKPIGDTMGMEINMDIDVDVDLVSTTQDGVEPEDDGPNTVDFAQREKDEMRDLTKASEILSCYPLCAVGDDHTHTEEHDLSGTTTASHWDPMVGQVFLGNANDVPFAHEQPVPLMHPQQQAALTSRALRSSAEEGFVDEVLEDDPFYYKHSNDPASAHGFDLCIECHDLAPFPTASQLRAAEEHLGMLEKMWVDKCKSQLSKRHPPATTAAANPQHEYVLPPRPPPNANAVIHLPFPSSPSNTQSSVAATMPIIKFLEKCIKPVEVPPTICIETGSNVDTKQDSSSSSSPGRRWSSAAAHSSLFSGIAYAAYAVRTRSLTAPSSFCGSNPAADTRSRPLKVLLFSSDGYTESSVPALCLLMAVRGLSLPEAYLELQTVKRRSFFVYQGDLGFLKRIEGRFREDRQRENMQRQVRERGQTSNSGRLQAGWSWHMSDVAAAGYRYTSPNAVATAQHDNQPHHHHHHNPSHHHHTGRLAARSVSYAQSPLAQYNQIGTAEQTSIAMTGSPGSASVPADSSLPPPQPRTLSKGRPRAKTSPWLPSLIGDHQSWFNDPRFDGSFPSRVLPFLYLGNLNHALNAYMLHALGITHVVSVGECALVPPPVNNLIGIAQGGGTGGTRMGATNAQYIPGRGPGGQGSLWIEEREGRIKVLDIQGICDDGIDTLEPQLEPICDWIDKAREEGGKVLVHCRVGVSRSATVTIAFVMKHLGVSLVDAYLIVRSRRLSVLIQPNMRLLYNLCGWEIKLARELVKDDEHELKLKKALARTLSWPYLAKEVHALNEKYLH